MKKFLLTAISAAFVACVAVAQPLANPFAAKIPANALRMGQQKINRNVGITPVEHGMHTLAHENTTRDPKEISFQVTGNEILSLVMFLQALIPICLKKMALQVGDLVWLFLLRW